MSKYSSNSQILDTKRGPLLGKFNPETKDQILKDENSISEEIQAYLKDHYNDHLTPSTTRLTAFRSQLRLYARSSLESKEGKRSRWTVCLTSSRPPGSFLIISELTPGYSEEYNRSIITVRVIPSPLLKPILLLT